MKASDIVEDALQLRGVLQKELAERVGQDHKYLSRKLTTNSMKAQELIDLIHELGYEIKLVDCQGSGQTVSVRRRASSAVLSERKEDFTVTWRGALVWVKARLQISIAVPLE